MVYEIDDTDFNNDETINNTDILLLNIDGYEGPLDVLLNLTKSQKIDITKISILELVDQYLDFIKKAKLLNLELASDYLVMASILAYIKSNLIIPKEDEDEFTQDEISDALAFNLRRLNSMREAANNLFERNLLGITRFYNGKTEEHKEIINSIYECNFRGLILSYANVINSKNIKPLTITSPKLWSLENALNRIKYLFTIKKKWYSLKVFMPSEMEVDNTILSRKIAWATTFAATLELARTNKVEITQKKSFDKILLRKD